MAEIDLSKEVMNTFLGWFVATALTNEKMLNVFPTREAIAKAEVKLTVNGVELDVQTAMKELKAQYDRVVSERAAELLDERYHEVYQALETLKEKIIVAG